MKGISKFGPPRRVKSVTEFTVALENGETWNKRRVALFCKKGEMGFDGAYEGVYDGEYGNLNEP